MFSACSLYLRFLFVLVTPSHVTASPQQWAITKNIRRGYKVRLQKLNEFLQPKNKLAKILLFACKISEQSEWRQKAKKQKRKQRTANKNNNHAFPKDGGQFRKTWHLSAFRDKLRFQRTQYACAYVLSAANEW